jgi:hypothetical protein
VRRALFRFLEEVLRHGFMSMNLGIRAHYRSVFFELDGGTLIEDEVYIADPTATARSQSFG